MLQSLKITLNEELKRMMSGEMNKPVIFQLENATPHLIKIGQKTVDQRKITVFHYPRWSPGLEIFENVWRLMISSQDALARTRASYCQTQPYLSNENSTILTIKDRFNLFPAVILNCHLTRFDGIETDFCYALTQGHTLLDLLSRSVPNHNLF